MSFDVNGPSFSKPMIQEAQQMLNNGGGGNLGYFQRGKKKNKDNEKPIFEEEEDSFVSELEDENSPNEEATKVKDFFSNFVEKFKKPIKTEQKPKENPFA